MNKDLESPFPRWFTLPAKEQWLGRRAHVEVMTRADLPTVGNVKDVDAWLKAARGSASSFGIVEVRLHDSGDPAAPADASRPPLPESVHRREGESDSAYETRHQAFTRAAILHWREGSLTDAEACWLTALVESGLLPNQAAPGSKTARLVADYRRLQNSLPEPVRAPGVLDDGSGYDTAVFIRGDYQTPGPLVPRRMPEVLGGAPLASSHGDRLALATELTRAHNPLTARVMVNRIWHHLFGQGLVATPDNFGKMGARPTHPELLDHLAARFMREGWSVKSLIRHLVTTRAWRQSGQPSAPAATADPGNELLSHARLRRLPAESIRDSMLAVAGNLDPASGGPPVKVWYRTAADPDKQPPPGPLDGAGRRSLYLEVRRNFPGAFLSVFDFPRPNIPAGSRSSTNVPAQSLTLLNDPFVLHQAGVWAARIQALPLDDAARVRRMYTEAFSRTATAGETAAALAFVRSPGRSWKDLAHALFNMKEFIHLP